MAFLIISMGVEGDQWYQMDYSFSTNVPHLYPLENQKTFGFLMFSGGIEVGHWLKMG